MLTAIPLPTGNTDLQWACQVHGWHILWLNQPRTRNIKKKTVLSTLTMYILSLLVCNNNSWHISHIRFCKCLLFFKNTEVCLICYILIVQHLYKRVEFLRLWYWGLEPGPQDVKGKDPSLGSMRTKVGYKQFFHTWRPAPSVSLSPDSRREKLYSPWLCQLWSRRIRSSCFTPPVSFCRNSYCLIHICPLQQNSKIILCLWKMNGAAHPRSGSATEWLPQADWLLSDSAASGSPCVCCGSRQLEPRRTFAKPAEGEFLALLCHRMKGCVTQRSQEEHPGCCWYLLGFYHFIN